MVVLNPNKPDFFAETFPKPNVKSMQDYAQAYIAWAYRSNVIGWVDGMTMRVVGHDLVKLTKEPIEHGIFLGSKRYISDRLAKLLGVDPVPYPETRFSWLEGSVMQTQSVVAYHQGSSEFGSSQQQNQIKQLGYMPKIFEKYARYIIGEEGEHGIQMGYWLGMENGSDMAWLLVEDLLARIANSEDPNLQQPLVEFNPWVETLPEMGHYFDKQDRDGWSQLRNSRENANALYAAQMRYFLKQEGRHLHCGDQIIELYLKAGRIPMDLHLKMEWEWSARAYRLHGNPYNSGGALKYYQIGSKNPIYSLDRKGPNNEILTFSIPHPEGPNGYMTFQITPDLDKSNLNGYALAILRDILIDFNKKRSRMLSDEQRGQMKEYLKKVSMFVPDEARKEILESGMIPTAALSWRPYHLAFIPDPWKHLDGYYTDVFGYPIPSREQYLEYRKLVDLAPEDREKIRELTKTPGWMVEFEPGNREDVYKEGQVEPAKNDVVLFEFKVDPKLPTFKNLFTFPEAKRTWEAQMGPKAAEKPVEMKGTEGYQGLLDLYEDIVGDGDSH